MKNTLETRLGLFFALALICAAIILEMVGGGDFLKHGMPIKALFTNISELKRGDPVKMAGVPIGRVQEIGFDKDKVVVVMKITDTHAIVRTDSRASVRFTGLMGQNYVAIDFGSDQGAPVTANAVLATDEQPDFSMMMAKLDTVASGIKKLTDNFNEANFNDMLLPFTDFLAESKPQIMGVLSNAHAISDQIAGGNGTVGKLIYDDSLYNSALTTVTNLNQTASDIQATVDEAKLIVADIRAGKGTIGKLTTDEQLYTEITTAATNLKEILEKINQGKGSVGKLVNDDSLIKNAKMTLQKLDKATEGLEDQGPLSLLGVMANSIF